MDLLGKIFLYLGSLPNTLLFNFKYFKFIDAIRFPVIVSHRVWLKKLSGQVELQGMSFGSVRMGFNDVGIFDKKHSRTIWEVSGKVQFGNNIKIGHGSKICVAGELEVGNDFVMTAESTVIANKKITIGNHVLISWDVLIMDTDYHDIWDENDCLLNADQAIYIGNKVWIACRSTILKGVCIQNGNVIGACSTVTKSVTSMNSVIVGSPAKVVKEHITWGKHEANEKIKR
ncbi:MAG: acyltransferase [Zetaproteobacteria bacterium]|nr:acyltransferase [Zetaproteobacteria bacterium]